VFDWLLVTFSNNNKEQRSKLIGSILSVFNPVKLATCATGMRIFAIPVHFLAYRYAFISKNRFITAFKPVLMRGDRLLIAKYRGWRKDKREEP